MKYLKNFLIIVISIILAFSYFGMQSISKAKSGSVSDTMSGAGDFVSLGESKVSEAVEEDKLKDASDYIYNLLLAVGIIVAVAIGATLGIKFMISSVEEKAKIKELLIPYIAGCIVIFGAFGIWKLAVDIFKGF